MQNTMKILLSVEKAKYTVFVIRTVCYYSRYTTLA